MYSMTAACAHPQWHSHDQRVRVREAALVAIVFEHACSVQDFAVLADARRGHGAVHSAGVTEWQARCAGRLVSLGWDWVRLDDGALRHAAEVAPRTNIMLIDGRGYDLAADECDAALWKLIEAMPWQATAAASLDA